MWIVVALTGTACGGWSSDAGHPAPSSASALEQARVYERGTGVARDYHAAAEVYRTACDNGHGNVAACGALIRAQLRARGVEAGRSASRALADAVCLERRDPFACVAADLLADHKAAMPQALRDAINDVTSDLEPCDIVHLSECQARLLADQDDGRLTGRRRSQLRLQSCRVGIVEGCAAILQHARGADHRELAEAGRQLQTACDVHDADACAAAPDRAPVPPHDLCMAADYEACAALGCQGDAAARQRAASHGVDVTNCHRFDKQPERSRSEEAIAKMAEFKDKMCVCVDKACADRVTEDMTRWGQEQAGRVDLDVRISEDDTKAMATVVEEMTRCMTKAMMAGSVSP